MSSVGKVCLSYGDSLIRESEVEILRKNHWLNDLLISFYFEYLTEQKRTSELQVKLYPATLSQILKLRMKDSAEVPILLGDPALDTIQYGFWAVNNSTLTESSAGVSGSHWSLLVFSRPDDQFIHFDSFGWNNQDEAMLLAKNLRPHFSKSAKFAHVRHCHQQANGYDCGLHVLVNTEKILNYIRNSNSINEDGINTPSLCTEDLLTAKPQDATSLRNEMMAIIKSLSEANATSS